MAQPLRIAVFIDSMGFGGAERSLLAQLRHLDFSAVSVDLYTLPDSYMTPEVSANLPKEVRCLSLPVTRNRLWLRFCQLAHSFMIRLLPRLNIHRHWAEVYWRVEKSAFPMLPQSYDVAISYQQGIMTYYVAKKVNATKKIAWINSQLNGHGHRVEFSRKFYDKYDSIVAVCEAQKQMLAQSGYVDPCRLTTIYDIIDEENVRQRALEQCEIDRSHRWIFVTVARLSPEKNLGLAVDAARILFDNGVDFLWYIVGGGKEEYALRYRISQLGLNGRVILTGTQNNPFKFMNVADVYVQTSRNEGYGMTIAEARILGRPVVSTDFPMVHDQIKDGVNGLIADMTPESVADKIMELISDPLLMERIENNLSKERNLTAVTEPCKFRSLIFSHD